MNGRRRYQQMRSRRTLTWAFGTVSVVLLVTSWLLDFPGADIRFPGLDRLIERCRAAESKSLIVALGSSRFGCGLRSQAVNGFLHDLSPQEPVLFQNLAVTHGDLVVAEFVYARLRQAKVTPRLLFVEIAPESLASKNRWLGTHAFRQLTWLGAPAYCGDLMRSGSTWQFLRARWFGLFYFRQQERCQMFRWLLALMRQDPGEPNLWEDYERFFEVAMERGTVAYTADKVKAGEEYGLRYSREWLSGYHIGGTAAAALERLLARTGAEGCRVVLVMPPVTESQRQLYTAAVEAEFVGAIQGMLGRHEHVAYVDARSVLADGDFFDNHHPTLRGADALSRFLADCIQAQLRRPEALPRVTAVNDP